MCKPYCFMCKPLRISLSRRALAPVLEAISHRTENCRSVNVLSHHLRSVQMHKQKYPPRYVRCRRRRGAFLIGVLACLLIGSVLVGLTVQSALRNRREARLTRQLAQTEWLCEGGLIRAVSALSKSAEYPGETWQPELGLEPLGKAVVEIAVQAGAEPDTWDVRVVARLDSTTDSDGPMQRTKTLSVHR